MNPNKIAFITCVNNDLHYEEALYYINQLEVPDGMEIDVIGVQEANSMCAGYQMAMESSDAKYKVYMHQDVLIINRKFIEDVVKVFTNHPEIGLLGVVGAKTLPENAQAITSWDVGRVNHNCFPNRCELEQNEYKHPYLVEAVDGLIIVTQYDLPWKDDIFDGWDYYDISQCFEMKRSGYQVAVPYMDEAWCHHNNGYSKVSRYYDYCERFINEYQDVRKFKMVWPSKEKQEIDQYKSDLRKTLANLIVLGAKEQLMEVFKHPEYRGFLNLMEYETIADIVNAERTVGLEQFWSVEDTEMSLMEKYNILRMWVFRTIYLGEVIPDGLFSSQAIQVMKTKIHV